MDVVRIGLLEKIGFDWSLIPASSRINAWDNKFQDLKEYKEQHGEFQLDTELITVKARLSLETTNHVKGNCDVPQVRKTLRIAAFFILVSSVHIDTYGALQDVQKKSRFRQMGEQAA